MFQQQNHVSSCWKNELKLRQHVGDEMPECIRCLRNQRLKEKNVIKIYIHKNESMRV